MMNSGNIYNRYRDVTLETSNMGINTLPKQGKTGNNYRLRVSQ